MDTTKEAITPDEYSRYYSHNFYCTNCGAHQSKYVAKGTLVKSVKFPCHKCGCRVEG